ncbi:MAG: hypothetical protein Q7R95_07385 [bacterium]|nr:hypothetical protein [bacterium]
MDSNPNANLNDPPSEQSIIKPKNNHYKQIIILIICFIFLIFFITLMIIKLEFRNKSTTLKKLGISPNTINKNISINDILNDYTVEMADYPLSSEIPLNLQFVNSTDIKITFNLNKKIVTNLQKPIEITFSYGKAGIKENVINCEMDQDKFQIFVSNNGKLIPIETIIDKEKLEAKGKITSLYPNEYNSFTELILTVPSNKYIFGCGKNAQAIFENNYFDFRQIGIKFLLPEGFGRPSVMGVEGINASLPLTNKLLNQKITLNLFSTTSNKDLQPIDYDKVEYGYEAMKPAPFISTNEAVLNKSLITINKLPVLFVESKNNENKFIRYFVKNPNTNKNKGDFVYIFTLSSLININQELWNESNELTKTIINSIQFQIPTIFAY